jgi:hypothetical protein
MPDLVSTRWVRVSGLAASMAVVLATLLPPGTARTAWMSLVWVGLAITGSIWLGCRSTNRSVRQMIPVLEGEPLRALARVPQRPADPQQDSLIERNPR